MAPAVLTQALLPYMAPGSSVIYIGSTLCEQAVPGRLSYVTSKHALVGLMRATVQDLFGTGIHTACICPGFTDTPMLQSALRGTDAEGEQEEDARQVEERRRARQKSIEGMVSFGRLVRPDEIAAMIGTVSVSPAVNGTVMHLNLGQKGS
eukprot:NODE_19656_length_833_cov_3.873938.p1 GENE.NODE_19656_length_833_cov_3.873938~~NODE_19656_length_833_cov_3.873938.p1  ORF type:complete len:161 (-),score=63.64 NODE_19656_length_833_cov_3.873938:351-800(-)